MRSASGHEARLPWPWAPWQSGRTACSRPKGGTLALTTLALVPTLWVSPAAGADGRSGELPLGPSAARLAVRSEDDAQAHALGLLGSLAQPRTRGGGAGGSVVPEPQGRLPLGRVWQVLWLSVAGLLGLYVGKLMRGPLAPPIVAPTPAKLPRCPACGGAAQPSRSRHHLELVLRTLLPVQMFRCRSCRWRGVRATRSTLAFWARRILLALPAIGALAALVAILTIVL